MTRTLEVRLHGARVGRLVEGSRGGSRFELAPEYRALLPRPVLGQWFEDHLDEPVIEHRGLPAFFANITPESLRFRQLLARSAGFDDPYDDFALLLAVGADLPGALTMVDGPDEPYPAEPQAPALIEPATSDGLRFSLAGIQLKLSMSGAHDRLTLPARGRAGDWIVKFDSSSYSGLPQNEFATLRWAQLAGFDVPEHHLESVAILEGVPDDLRALGEHVLVIRRFDRSPAGPIHQEDFAQVIGLPRGEEPKYSKAYETLGVLARQILGLPGVDELVRRLVLMIATGNNDAHLKNWSLVYPDRLHAAWSPLYDQVSTIAWPSLDTKLALKMGGSKQPMHSVDRGILGRWARKVGVDEECVQALADQTLTRLAGTWAEAFTAMAPAQRAAVAELWRRVPLLVGHRLG